VAKGTEAAPLPVCVPFFNDVLIPLLCLDGWMDRFAGEITATRADWLFRDRFFPGVRYPVLSEKRSRHLATDDAQSRHGAICDADLFHGLYGP
jgi:hypothetical protein